MRKLSMLGAGLAGLLPPHSQLHFLHPHAAFGGADGQMGHRQTWPLFEGVQGRLPQDRKAMLPFLF